MQRYKATLYAARSAETRKNYFPNKHIKSYAYAFFNKNAHAGVDCCNVFSLKKINNCLGSIKLLVNNIPLLQYLSHIIEHYSKNYTKSIFQTKIFPSILQTHYFGRFILLLKDTYFSNLLKV